MHITKSSNQYFRHHCLLHVARNRSFQIDTATMSGVGLRRSLSSRPCYWQVMFQKSQQSPSIPPFRIPAIRKRFFGLEAADTLLSRKPLFIPRGVRLGLGPKRRIKVYPPPAAPPPKQVISRVTQFHLNTLDPSGAKSKLISRDNKDRIKPGDILRVRFTPQTQREPFSGLLINLRRSRIDTALLLRNHLTRVGVEMWIKLFNPNVEGIDVVQRATRRARRARLTYMRKPKHDIGSVENIVAQYIKQRALLRGGLRKEGTGGGKASGSAKKR